MAGFRFSLLSTRDGSPFDCDACAERDREARNCFNRKGLGEEARAVGEYTPDVVGEHREKRAKKVFRLGDLRLYECPLSYISTDSVEVMRIVYLADGSGSLLYPGGWGAQPAWLIEAFELYRGENYMEMEKRDDRTRR